MKRTNFPFFQVVRKVVPVAMLFGMIFLVGATDASAQNYLPREEAIENVAEYIQALLRYRILGRARPQLTELLLGLFGASASV